MLTKRRNVSSNVTMNVRKNNPTERVIKMSYKNKYVSVQTGRVYNMVYNGNALFVLMAEEDGREVTVPTDEFTTYFIPYKQAKRNEDLGVLTNITDEIRKLLDDNHVICYANVNRDTKGLVEFKIMVGESK